MIYVYCKLPLPFFSPMLNHANISYKILIAKYPDHIDLVHIQGYYRNMTYGDILDRPDLFNMKYYERVYDQTVDESMLDIRSDYIGDYLIGIGFNSNTDFIEVDKKVFLKHHLNFRYNLDEYGNIITPDNLGAYTIRNINDIYENKKKSNIGGINNYLFTENEKINENELIEKIPDDIKEKIQKYFFTTILFNIYGARKINHNGQDYIIRVPHIGHQYLNLSYKYDENQLIGFNKTRNRFELLTLSKDKMEQIKNEALANEAELHEVLSSVLIVPHTNTIHAKDNLLNVTDYYINLAQKYAK